MRTRAVLASGLALLLAVLVGIGAPPSEFAPRTSRWWTFEPLLEPALFAGVVLAVFALLASWLAPRAAAVLCSLASLSTATGLVIAEGISAHPALGSDAVAIALVAIPAIAAVSILTRAGDVT